MKKIIKKVAAISYDKGDYAPKVIAIGRGDIADKIIEAAKENDIPIFENKQLVDNLLNFEIGDHISPELYEVVAQILVFISDIDRLKGEADGK